MTFVWLEFLFIVFIVRRAQNLHDISINLVFEFCDYVIRNKKNPRSRKMMNFPFHIRWIFDAPCIRNVNKSPQFKCMMCVFVFIANPWKTIELLSFWICAKGKETNYYIFLWEHMKRYKWCEGYILSKIKIHFSPSLPSDIHIKFHKLYYWGSRHNSIIV